MSYAGVGAARATMQRRDNGLAAFARAPLDRGTARRWNTARQRRRDDGSSCLGAPDR
jgi:hypothetical protein